MATPIPFRVRVGPAKHAFQAVDQVRRDEVKEKGREHKQLIKHSRYIWVKNPWNLTEKQKAKLGSLEKLNLKISRAYLLKESFRNLWSYKTVGWASKYLKQWFWWGTHCRLDPIRKFAWTIRRHEENILSYSKLPINNASVEGFNNKAKIISMLFYLLCYKVTDNMKESQEETFECELIVLYYL